ncbi:hypothetical protein WKI68_12090 [Streptomyces sp. MS1.HAVA.3]|uniref:Uncharacterized protein n=1 Tax=Streptomyces caledonius TaxID=3134107 RepID=A0ABU8U2V0_9ACTN
MAEHLLLHVGGDVPELQAGYQQAACTSSPTSSAARPPRRRAARPAATASSGPLRSRLTATERCPLRAASSALYLPAATAAAADCGSPVTTAAVST